MKSFLTRGIPPLLLAALLPCVTASSVAAADQSPAPNSKSLDQFLGAPLFVPMQELWKGRGGTSLMVAPDGSLIAFKTFEDNYRRSTDGGKTWTPGVEFGQKSSGGKALVDETTGDVLYVNPEHLWLWRSHDNGSNWVRETIAEVRPDRFGLTPSSVGAMQPGITLKYGKHPGRLIMPARIMGPKASNDVEWRPYHYSTAIYSDDHGRTWQTSNPFPVLGTGEAALAELSDGSILYNSREHMSRGNRYLAWSYDDGELWLKPVESAELPDGARGTSYGCMGGMIRLPVDGADVLLYSNLDTDCGVMPKKVGASTSVGREKITVWASFDGGQTWPVKRLVYGGPAAYSNLAAGRAGTPSEGKIYILFEGGPAGHYSAIQVAAFNLAWVIEGRDPAALLKKRVARQ